MCIFDNGANPKAEVLSPASFYKLVTGRVHEHTPKFWHKLCTNVRFKTLKMACRIQVIRDSFTIEAYTLKRKRKRLTFSCNILKKQVRIWTSTSLLPTRWSPSVLTTESDNGNCCNIEKDQCNKTIHLSLARNYIFYSRQSSLILFSSMWTAEKKYLK